ncbi:MAG: hypothetical protein JSS04_21910 [Proteobacteria bacterium]|nr:hypothetical protein [Pseudomonadota bacterium]
MRPILLILAVIGLVLIGAGAASVTERLLTPDELQRPVVLDQPIHPGDK